MPAEFGGVLRKDDDSGTESGDGTDGKDGECNPGCAPEMLSNGNCDKECKNLQCGFDGNDCENANCVDGCLISTIGDGVCNEPCNTGACDYDGGDCGGGTAMGCPPGCEEWMIGNNECNYICLGNDCGNDGGDCDDDVECVGGCQHVMLGDGKCDEACNNPECFMDNGDCSNGSEPGCELAGDCIDDCVPCVRVTGCKQAVRICNENVQCIFLQDCVSVNCDDKKTDAGTNICLNECFGLYPDGVTDFEMMRQCLYCTGCADSCRAEFGDFCDSFAR